MFFYEGQSCPVCEQHFAETDDIVVCPECGAPHHRECWKREGHCHFAADHGTERQWAKQTDEPKMTKRRCPHCGNENPEFAEFCAHCGREVDPVAPPPPVNQYTPGGGFPPPPFPTVDPFGGVSRTEQIDGVPVEVIAKVIGPNSAYYLPRIKEMSETGRKVFWNFPAFLIPYNWLLYRKNLLVGWLIFAFYTVVNLFFNSAAERLFPDNMLPSMTEMVEQIMAGGGSLLWTAMSVASMVMIAVHVLCGLFGNWIYMQQVMKKARKLMDDPEPYNDQQFLRTGGISPAMGILPELILLFLESLRNFISLI